MKKILMYIKAAFNITNLKFVVNSIRQSGLRQFAYEMKEFNKRCDAILYDIVDVPGLLPLYNKAIDINKFEKIVCPKYDSPTVSIIIPVYNGFGYTYNCIKTVVDNSVDVTYEIIIADDCSTDITIDIEKVIDNLVVIHNENNQRFLRNCNNAAKNARGKYILFLNNDTQVQKNWLKPLVDLIESDKTIGMVGSKLIYPDGSLQEAGGIIWGNGNAWNYGNGQNPEMPEFNYVKEVDYISGASLMIRTELWGEIGGFDERYVPAYCEDSDLAFEVRKKGYKLMYQPLSVVVHFEGKSNGTDVTEGIKAYQVENGKKLQEKWKSEYIQQSSDESEVFVARDRSQNKKTVLVIDHYIPQYDKDAGSKTVWQYLKMFVEKGYNVKFLGDNFYRSEPYCTELQQMGIEVLYGEWYAKNYKEWIIRNQKYIAFAYLNRPHISEKYIDFLRNETNIKCIYYGHDFHYLRLYKEYKLTHNESKLVEANEWKEKELNIMRNVDMSYYPSFIERDEIAKIDSSIKVKDISAYILDSFMGENDNFDQRDGLLFVGGFGHPPNLDAVSWFVREIWPLISDKIDAKFYIVGSNAPKEIQRLDSERIVVKGFVSEEELKQLYNSCKMAVVPLRYGAGIKGKVVEALNYGIPIVSTSVGIEGIYGAENVIDVADDALEFAQKVVDLYTNNDELSIKFEKSKTIIVERFSVDAAWNIISEDFV